MMLKYKPTFDYLFEGTYESGKDKQNPITRFVLPLVFNKTNLKVSKIISNDFINAFTYWDEKPDIENKIFLLYKVETIVQDAALLLVMRALPEYYGDWSYFMSSEYRIICFNVPQKFKADYKLILQGRYKDLTYKSEIKEFWINQLLPYEFDVLKSILKGECISESVIPIKTKTGELLSPPVCELKYSFFTDDSDYCTNPLDLWQ